MTKKKQQIPLADMLRAIDTNNLSFYENLSDDGKKEFSPWLAMRWASNSDSHPEHYLLMVNGLVNVDFSDLNHHPELQWKLLAVCGSGKSHRHSWVAPPKKGKLSRVLAFLRKLYPEAKQCDLEQLETLLDRDSIVQLAESAGLGDKEIKELLKK